MSKFYSGLGSQTFDGENMKLEGVSTFAGGTFNKLEIAGIISISGDGQVTLGNAVVMKHTARKIL